MKAVSYEEVEQITGLKLHGLCKNLGIGYTPLREDRAKLGAGMPASPRHQPLLYLMCAYPLAQRVHYLLGYRLEQTIADAEHMAPAEQIRAHIQQLEAEVNALLALERAMPEPNTAKNPSKKQA